MPKVTDLKAYWSELAKKNGIDDETLKPLLEVMDKESVKKAFSEGFKPLPDYSHDLDDVRNRAKQEKDDEYKAWYDVEQKKYNEYLASIERAKQYETKFGKLDATQTPNPGGPPMLTKEDFEKLMDAKLNDTLSRRDSAYMDLLEVREQHISTFKKPLNVQEFEVKWKEHPEWGNSMKAAYKFYVEPEMDKFKEVEFETKLKAKYDEGLRDGFSRRSLPVDNGAKTFSPMFDRKEDVAKMSERQQEDHSRGAFFEGLRESMKPA